MSNSFVWVDIPATDIDRAIAFYSGVLGKPVTKEGGEGFIFGLFDHHDNDVGGCVYLGGEDNLPSAVGPMVYLNADGRLGAAVKAVGELGGQVLQSPHEIGPHGWRAVIQDSEGNRVALHSSTE